MKVLLYDNGKGIKSNIIKSKSHKLDELYELFSDKQKKEIEKELNNYKVENEIKRVEDAFYRVRYSYLNALFGMSKPFNFNPVFIKKFNLVLIRLCEEKYKKV